MSGFCSSEGAAQGREGGAEGLAQKEGERRHSVFQADVGPIFHEDRRYRAKEVELHEDLGGRSHRQRLKQGHFDWLQRHSQGNTLMLPDGLRAVQQQRRQTAGPVPLPACRRVGDHRGGNRKDRGLSPLHHLLSLLQLRQDHQAGGN